VELYEYQAKMLLQRFHVPCVPHFLIEEGMSFDRFQEIGGGVLRPQVRGKIVGDVEKEALNKQEFEQRVKELLGKKIVTDESGPEGFLVKHILFVSKLQWDKQFSLHIGISELGEIVVRVKEGEKSFSEIVTERKKLFRFQLSRLVAPLHFASVLKQAVARAIDGAVDAFFQFDAKSVEIDPFIVTEEESLLAYRVRMNVDEMALYRQGELRELLSTQQETVREHLTKSSFPYTILGGTIGCLANGKGLVEYTALQVSKSGGGVAGMLDIGEVCTKENLISGLNLLMRDPAVNVVCINLLTGLLDGEVIAATLLKTLAAKRGIFFLRLEGTNAGGGCARLKSSDNLKATTSLEEAVRMAVEASKG
jgi:succinyl-CoA synthetase beta subunit